MQCNIDQRGRQVRFSWGVVMLALAGPCAAATVVGWLPTLWGYLGAVLLLALAMLAFFEARKGWCIVRAMGFDTRV